MSDKHQFQAVCIAIEAGISGEYLSLLNDYYEDWLSRFDLCPVLTIPADELDFVQHPQHLAIIAQTVRQKLAGKEEVIF